MKELEREYAASVEWLDQEQGTASNITLPEPDEDYCYGAMRLLSFWPVVNSRGATYKREDFSEDLLKTLLGKQVNVVHDKINKVVGSIIGYELGAEGIDIAVRFDREQASAHDLSPSDMQKGGYFSHCSLELTKDSDNSTFYAYDESFNIKQSIPVPTGRRMGVRRTVESDPYTLQGLRVAECIKPARFTGVGMVPNPADKTAKLFAITASDGTEDERPLDTDELYVELLEPDYELLIAEGDLEVAAAEREEAATKKALTPGSNYADPGYKGVKKYQLDSEGNVRSAARFWGIASYRAGYTPEQQRHISAAIARAKRKYGIGDPAEKAHAVATDSTVGGTTLSALTLEQLQSKVTELETAIGNIRAEKETAAAEATTRISELEAKVTSLETELASANEKITGYETEKAEAAKTAKLDGIVAEFEAIKPFADDAARAAFREKAAAVCDQDGVIHALRLERKLEAAEEKLAAVEAAKAEAPVTAPAKTEVKPSSKEGEKASAAGDAREDLEPPVTVSTANGKTVTYEPGKYI